MSWNKIYRIRDALLTVSKDVYHFEALKKKDKYIVWAEDGEGNSGHADNKKNQVIQGTIDYFTKDDADPVVEEMCNVFWGIIVVNVFVVICIVILLGATRILIINPLLGKSKKKKDERG